MKRIGVFVCHCGVNIAGVVDPKEIVDAISQYPGVVYCINYEYMCSDPGQKMVEDAIKEEKLDGVVIAACSPTLHEKTFQDACKRAGLNPYLCEMANIREHCTWVHVDKVKAKQKAIKIIISAVEKVKNSVPLFPIKIPVNKKCLVIGGGVSGIQAALDIADGGYEVLLVEKSPSIGGHMAQLSETFPTLDCSQCILTPKMVAVSRHPNIRLLTYSEVIEVSGYVGNFHVKILKKPRYVIEEKCNLCNECEKVCPQTAPNEFDNGLSLRKAIYIPFPQAIPSTYTLDEEACLGLHPLRCDECKKVCEPGAIDYDMKPEIIEEDVGAIVIATGYELYPMEKIPEYGYGEYIDVINGIHFERLLSASGPTNGEIRRPSDGKIPKEVVFIQCVGSRDPEQHCSYCSKICCMYTAKHAMLYKHRVPDGHPTVFYIDIRAGGKDYEEFVQRAVEEDGVTYIRGKVAKVFQEGDKIMVWGVDTLTGKKIEIAADMVVLAMAMVPSEDVKHLSQLLKVATDEYGFLKEAHPKLRPIESLTTGIYLAGAAHAPKDIPETVAQASGTAGKVLSLFSADELTHDPIVATVNENMCRGCGFCVSVCPYDAITLKDVERFGYKVKVAEVNEALCKGCGACSAACLNGAIQQKGFTDKQILAMIDALGG
ncbi:MAG: CoB--CoM heterodisulfide reductase iron-sulfur subunit A family protein [Thermoplasmata archaeon]|nr:MAG: CoB--CoM heterodisulfide reductase iron-sulfur subunit A family protein [Thermoplasmata archaeon]